MQGRRDFAFDLDHALTAYSRLKAPKRLYLADFGHPPAANPPGEAAHVLPEARAWFDRYLKGLPNGIDRQPPIEVAPDPWTGRTFHYRALPRGRRCGFAFPGRAAIGSTGKVARTRPRLRTRTETFGAPLLRVSLASPNGWPQVVAVLSALTPQRKEIVVSAGGRARPPRREAEAGEDPADLAADRDSQRLPAAADDRRHLDRPELRQPPLLHRDSSRRGGSSSGLRACPCRCSRSRYPAESVDSGRPTESLTPG